MKKQIIVLIIFILFINGCNGCDQQIMPEEDLYDVIIIGGGLAGISATYQLRDKKILLLEKENRLGGRILTKNLGKYTYELGALFGYTSQLLPEGFETKKLIRESNNIGFYLNNKLYLGNDMQSAINSAIETDADKSAFSKIGEISSVEEIMPQLSKDIADTIKASFNIIHPGNFNEYVNSRKMDAFITFETSHYVGGNKTLIEIYSDLIKERYITGAEVQSIEKKDEKIIVRYVKDGNIKELTTRAAIVATPASVAIKLIKGMNSRSEKFLRSIKYGKGISVVILTNKGRHPQFSYIATPEKSFNTIFQNRSSDDLISVYTAYFIDSFINKNPELKEKDYINITLDELRTMNIGNFDDSNILAKDSYFWKNLGTVISNESYSYFEEKSLEPLNGVFLAGDYTFWNKTEMPYGIDAAFESGKIVSEKVKKYLEGK